MALQIWDSRGLLIGLIFLIFTTLQMQTGNYKKEVKFLTWFSGLLSSWDYLVKMAFK